MRSCAGARPGRQGEGRRLPAPPARIVPIKAARTGCAWAEALRPPSLPTPDEVRQGRQPRRGGVRLECASPRPLLQAMPVLHPCAPPANLACEPLGPTVVSEWPRADVYTRLCQTAPRSSRPPARTRVGRPPPPPIFRPDHPAPQTASAGLPLHADLRFARFVRAVPRRSAASAGRRRMLRPRAEYRRPKRRRSRLHERGKGREGAR